MAGQYSLTLPIYFIQLFQSKSHTLTWARGDGFWRCTLQSLITMYITGRVMISLIQLSWRMT